MTPLSCIIIDDDELDLYFIRDLVLRYSDLRLAGCYSNALESMETLRTTAIDLLFVDIDMPIINGINFLKTLENPPLCIFVTSHVEYALEAFDVHAIDYLLKPVRKERFDIAVRRASEFFSVREKALHYELRFEKETIIIKEGNTVNNVSVDELIYLEALANYTKVVTRTRKYITLKNLKNFLEELPGEEFVRIHRSYAAAKSKIESLHSDEITVDGFVLPIGKTYRKNISNALRKSNSI
jgi:DNA-binding LytR/AlgR family response regulator